MVALSNSIEDDDSVDDIQPNQVTELPSPMHCGFGMLTDSFFKLMNTTLILFLVYLNSEENIYKYTTVVEAKALVHNGINLALVPISTGIYPKSLLAFSQR